MTGQAQTVTAYLQIGGQTVFVEEMTVSLTKTGKSEKFSARVQLNNPASQGLDQQTNANVQVFINGQTVGTTFLLEQPTYDFTRGIIDLSGRDQASASLIDQQNTKTFTNQTPDNVVQQVASPVPVQMDPISMMAGKIYQIDWNAITHRAAVWDAVKNQADLNGLNAYTTGGTLYVESIDMQFPVYMIMYSPPTPMGDATCNVIDLKCSQNGPASKKHKVTTRSYNYKQQKALSANASAGGNESTGATLEHEIVLAGSTQDQLQSIATKKAKEYSKQAFHCDVEIFGDLTVVPRMQLSLQGTGTIYDQTYDIDTVEHRVEFGHGFTTKISAKSGGKNSSSGSSS